MLKVKEFIEIDGDIDVTDSLIECFDIAFVGEMKLTDEGKRVWADVLDFGVSFNRNFDIAIIHVENEAQAHRAAAFFEAAAGFCPVDEWDAWFVY